MNYFATLYDTFLKIPIYSAYKVEDFSMPDNEEFKRQWSKEDDLANTEQPFLKDYNGVQLENLNRGHLAPRFYTPNGRTATDVLTNIAPQYDKFNQKTWYSLEKNIFEASKKYCKSIAGVSYFLTGVIPSRNMAYNNFNEINIPSSFWTAVCCDTSRATSRNNSKGWSFAYASSNYNYEIPRIDIYTVEEFLKSRPIQKRYHNLFTDITVYRRKHPPRIVKNCLFDPGTANAIIQKIIFKNSGVNFFFHRPFFYNG